MFGYILKRLGYSLVIVWGVLTIIFLIIKFAPGDPASIYVTPEIDPDTVENIRKQMGLDLPLGQQYFLWMGELITGNFGVSFSHHREVSKIFAEAIPNTLRLTMVVFALQYVAGILLGVVMAVKRDSKIERALNAFLLFIYSMPGFWFALLLIWLFSLKLGWLPSSHIQSIQPDSGFWSQFTDRLRHLILPVCVLSAPFIAYTARFVRGSLVEVLEQDYILTAYAYGIKRRRIIFYYALKNALLPLATLAGLYLPFLLGGAVIIEYIFAWPGMGSLTVDAIFAHDFPVILASCSIAATAVVVGNLLSDLLYALVDPRIQLKPKT